MVEVGVDQGPLPQPDEVGCPYVVGLELCGNEGHELVKEMPDLAALPIKQPLHKSGPAMEKVLVAFINRLE